MNSAHFSLKLRKDRKRKDKTYSIYLYANINRKISWYSTGKSVKEKDWNKSEQEARASAPKWKKINEKIKLYKSKAESYIQKCDFHDEIARPEVLDEILRSSSYETNSYYEFVEYYKENFKNKYASKTLQGFTTHLNKMKEFRSELDFRDINIALWKSYETHLIEEGNNQNTIHKQSRQLKKFLNLAVELGVISENPLQKLRVKSQDGNREFLTIDELNKLQEKYDKNDFKGSTMNVLRYFLFACYTSCRYQDVLDLRYENIINDSIHFEMHKTGKLITIPLSEKAKALIAKSKVKKQKVFKVLTNQATNRHLKKIMTGAKINKNISFHCARNTWAMISLELTENIALVSSVLGHSNLKTTQIYAKVQEKAKKDVMGKWDAF